MRQTPWPGNHYKLLQINETSPLIFWHHTSYQIFNQDRNPIIARIDVITHRIMVIDDDESIRESLRKLLASEGYQVIAAANGTEGIEIFRREGGEVDLLLVDLNMPRKNGWVTLSQFLEFNPALPIFIVTGISDQIELAAAAGVRALVEKPIDVPELLSLVKNHFAAPATADSPNPSYGEGTFRHVRAMSDLPCVKEIEHRITPHHHWGLNE